MSFAEIMPKQSYRKPDEGLQNNAGTSSNLNLSASLPYVTLSVAHAGIGHNRKIPVFRYSSSVAFKLKLGAFLMILSGVLSLTSLVSETKSIGVLGAFLLAIAFFVLSSWIDTAQTEKSAHLGSD